MKQSTHSITALASKTSTSSSPNLPSKYQPRNSNALTQDDGYRTTLCIKPPQIKFSITHYLKVWHHEHNTAHLSPSAAYGIKPSPPFALVESFQFKKSSTSVLDMHMQGVKLS